MATLTEIVDDTYDLLYGVAQVERPKTDTLNGALNSSVTTAAWDTATMWKRGDFAESEENGEILEMLVDAGTTIIRARPRGQTTAAAQSDGGVFARNPTHPRYLVERMINQVIDNELANKVWIRNHRSLTPVLGDSMYNLDVDDIDIDFMYQFDIAGDNRLRPLPFGWWDVPTPVHADAASTLNVLVLRRVHNQEEDVYYATRTRPNSSDIADIPDDIVACISWLTVGKLLSSKVAPQRSRASRNPQRVSQSGDRLLRDASFFRAEGERMVKDVQLRLRRELQKDKQFRTLRRRVG